MNSNIIDNIIKDVESNADYILQITDKTVKSYTQDLDSIMQGVYDNVISVDNAPSSTLEKYFLELSNCVYFVAERAEKVGIYDGVSKATAREAYNSAYMDSQSFIQPSGGKKPTVAESTAKAETESLHETMVNEIYSRAYRIIKAKIDAAQTMISTISKILSKRMSENQFSIVNNNTRQILNEEVSFKGPDLAPF